MFNLAVREELVDKNPCWKVKVLPENNIRDRILSAEELGLLFPPSPACRCSLFCLLDRDESRRNLQSYLDKVDLKEKAIKLMAAETKTSEPRVIFLNAEVLEILMEAGKVRGLGHNRVFTYKGQPIASIKTCLLLTKKPVSLIFASMIYAIPSIPI